MSMIPRRPMLNNITAKLSLELLAFESAAKFASKGIVSLLALKDGSLQEGGENAMWVAQGELAISLHTVGAEAEYGQGNTDQASTYCNESTTRRIDMTFSMYFHQSSSIWIFSQRRGTKKKLSNLPFLSWIISAFGFPQAHKRWTG